MADDIVDNSTFRAALERADDTVEGQLGGLKKFAEVEIIIDYNARSVRKFTQ